jgi:hypothetical protein
MIYVIGTVARTGSSMMMRAIEGSSDLVPVRGVGKEVPRHEGHDPDYDPNPNGYYEPDWTEIEYGDEGTTWAQNYEGRLLKLRPHGLLRLRPGAWRVCLMLRDPEEIRVSHRRAFGTHVSEGDLLDLRMCEGVLSARSDVDLMVFNYADVVASPQAAFTALALHGWPINPLVAATFVDPTLYRNRTSLATSCTATTRRRIPNRWGA